MGGAELRPVLGWLTLGRLAATSCGRMLAPLAGVIAVGLGVSVVQVGIAIALFEGAGLAAPVAGWVIDRVGARHIVLVGAGGFAVATLAASLTSSAVTFAVLVGAAGLASNLYESAATVWVAGAVPFAERARWLGRLDVAWPAGLLIGLPVAGALTVVSWRLPLVAVAVVSSIAFVRLASRPPVGCARSSMQRTRWSWVAVCEGRAMVGSFAAIASANQLLVVSFGVWLTEEHGVSTMGVGAIGFTLGVADLAATTTSIGVTDRVGKSRTATIGAAIVAICSIVLALVAGTTAFGVITLTVAVGGHELALLASKPLLADLDPAHPGFGVGIGFGAAAVGRSLAAIAGLGLYAAGGMPAVAASASGVAAIAALTCHSAVRDPASPIPIQERTP